MAKAKKVVKVKKKVENQDFMFTVESPTLFDLKMMAINVIDKLGGTSEVRKKLPYEDYYCLVILSTLNITKQSKKNFFLFGKQYLV